MEYEDFERWTVSETDVLSPRPGRGRPRALRSGEGHCMLRGGEPPLLGTGDPESARCSGPFAGSSAAVCGVCEGMHRARMGSGATGARAARSEGATLVSERAGPWRPSCERALRNCRDVISSQRTLTTWKPAAPRRIGKIRDCNRSFNGDRPTVKIKLQL